MGKNERLEVTIKYNDFKQIISGSPEIVTREYFNVLSKVIPAFDVASDLIARPNLTDMAAKLRGLVHLYKDRVIILKRNPKSEDAILLVLVTKYIGFGLKTTTSDSMTLQEIIESTGKTKKAVVNILDKLKLANAIEQVEDRYRISDWKAYEYVLRKLPEAKPVKLTDFVNENNQPVNHRLIAFTIGYEGHAPDQFLKSLNNEGIEVLVDVRKDAYSKQDNAFSEGTLSRIAADARIKYVHLPELGVDYNLRQELKSTHDYESYFRRYSEYLDKNPELISFLTKLSKNNVICLMCYEKDFRRCHRSILADKLEEMGITFHHM
jgi:uncharacterized protein (DUF488 family)